jgi:GntR family transcriptional repressor for pyruvate dehydrogenase complex
MVEDELLQRLLGLIGELGPDQRIPAERQIEEDWGVSRGALRHRLQLLEAMCVVERRGAAGTYTKAMQPRDVARILRVGLNATTLANAAAFRSLRAALETEAALLAARNGTPVPVAYIEEAVLRMDAADDAQTLYQADLDFHNALFDACRDPGLQFFYEALFDVTARSVHERRLRMYSLAEDVDLMRRLHRAILVAIQAHDQDAAVAAMRDHFDRIDSLRPIVTQHAAAAETAQAAESVDVASAASG